MTQNCIAAFGAYIGKAYDDSDLIIYSLVPTDDTWRSGDACSAPPTCRGSIT